MKTKDYLLIAKVIRETRDAIKDNVASGVIYQDEADYELAGIKMLEDRLIRDLTKDEPFKFDPKKFRETLQ